MAQLSVATFKTTKNSRFGDNSNGDISELDSRDMYEDVADSFFNITDANFEESGNNLRFKVDNNGDWGDSTHRIKDLWMAGGIYLGGTTSANFLDDYEEGTWTPSFTNSPISSADQGQYVKVGGMVFINGYSQLGANGANTNDVVIDNSSLPFSPLVGGGNIPVITVGGYNFTGVASGVLIITGPTSGLRLRDSVGLSPDYDDVVNETLNFHAIYYTTD